jgi:NitT/TauT family transport system substrate-binding protein
MGSKVAMREGVEMTFKPLQKVGAIIGALKSGQIDSWSIVPHIAKPLAGAGAVKIIGDIADYIPDYQVTTVFTSTDNAENQVDMTTDFIGAYSKGVADYDSIMVDRSEGEAGVNAMVELIHKYVYQDQPLEKAAPSIINGTMWLNKGAALNVGSVEDQLNWFQTENLVSPDVSMDDLVNTSYVDVL